MTKEFTKGTWHRPLRVPKEEFESNWDKIFKASKDREVEVPINAFGAAHIPDVENAAIAAMNEYVFGTSDLADVPEEELSEVAEALSPTNQAKNIPWRDAKEGYGFVHDIDKV